MQASTKGYLSPMNSAASPFMLRAKSGMPSNEPTMAHPQTAGAQGQDSVRFSGVAPALNNTMELNGISDNRTLFFPGTIDVTESANIGSISAGLNAFLQEVNVNGNVTAQKGEIQAYGSDIHGVLKAPGDIEVTHTDTLKGIHAGGFVDTDDVLVNGDVVSDNKEIKFINSAATGKLIAPKDEILVKNEKSEATRGVGGIESGSHVTVINGGNVGNIVSGGDVHLEGDTATKDIIVHSKPGETPEVNIGSGVTVKGNIKFENGNGIVNYEKGAKLLGKTIGGQQTEIEKLEKRDTNYCDPTKDDFSDGDNCDPTINLSHNPFNLTQQQLNNAAPCPDASSKPPLKKGLLVAGLLFTYVAQRFMNR